MSVIDEVLAANASYAQTFPGPLPGPPARHLAVLTCMDARLDVAPLLGLGLGEAHVIRNAGGLVTPDSLRSLVISQRALGTTAVLVAHHTRCGMQGFDDAAFRSELALETAQDPDWSVPGFADPAEQVAASVAAVRACPWLPHRDEVRGFVVDVDSGTLTEVGI
jgi:carbonic anhydrase